MRTPALVTAIALISMIGCESADLEEKGYYDKITAVVPQTVANEDDSDVTPIEELGFIGACDAEHFQQRWEVDLQGGALRAVDWAPNGRVAVATEDGRIELLDMSDGAGASQTLYASMAVQSLVLDDHGDSVITADASVRATVWDTATSTVAGTVAPGNAPLRAVSLSSDGHFAAAANANGEMVVWSPVDGTGQFIDVSLGQIHAIVQPADRVVVGGAVAGRPAIELFHPVTGAFEGTWIASQAVAGSARSAIMAMAHYDTLTVAVGGGGPHGVVAILRKIDGEYSLAEAMLRDHTPVSVEILPDGDHFATVNAEGTLRVWNLHTLQVVQEIEVYGAVGVSIDPYTSTLATAGEDGVLRGFGCGE